MSTSEYDNILLSGSQSAARRPNNYSPATLVLNNEYGVVRCSKHKLLWLLWTKSQTSTVFFDSGMNNGTGCVSKSE